MLKTTCDFGNLSHLLIEISLIWMVRFVISRLLHRVGKDWVVVSISQQCAFSSAPLYRWYFPRFWEEGEWCTEAGSFPAASPWFKVTHFCLLLCSWIMSYVVMPNMFLIWNKAFLLFIFKPYMIIILLLIKKYL